MRARRLIPLLALLLSLAPPTPADTLPSAGTNDTPSSPAASPPPAAARTPAAAPPTSALTPATGPKVEKDLHDRMEYIEWRPLTDMDWAAGANEALGIRHAVILYDGTVIDDRRQLDQQTVFSRYQRVRVLDPQGVSAWRTVRVPYDAKGKIYRLMARTVKPDGSARPVTGIDDRAVFSTGRRHQREKVLTFPDLAEGDILEYFLSESTSMDGIPLIRLRHEFYTVSAELLWWFYAPAVPKADAGVDERQQAFIPGYSVTGPHEFGGTLELLPAPDRAKRLHLAFQNLPPMPAEPFSPSDDEIGTGFVGWYRYPAQDRLKPYWQRTAEDWGDQSDNFLKKSSLLETWMRPILSAPRDTVADLDRCFHALHGYIRNLDYLPTSERPEDSADCANVDELLTRRQGSSRDLNLLLVAMLRRLHYQATLFWTRDRQDGVFRRQWENPEQFSLSGVAVFRGENLCWLFPAIPGSTPATLPWQVQDGGAVLEQNVPENQTPHFPLIDRIPMSRTADVERTLEVNLRLGPKGTLVGHLNAAWRGDADILSRESLAEEPEELRSRLLRGRALPAGLAWSADHERSSVDSTQVAYSCNVEIEGLVRDSLSARRVELGRVHLDDYAIPPGPREFQIQFDSRGTVRTRVRLALPPGFQVEGCGGERRAQTAYGGFRIGCQKQEDTIQLERELTLRECFFYPAAADSLRGFFGRLDCSAPITLREGRP